MIVFEYLHGNPENYQATPCRFVMTNRGWGLKFPSRETILMSYFYKGWIYHKDNSNPYIIYTMEDMVDCQGTKRIMKKSIEKVIKIFTKNRIDGYYVLSKLV